MLLAFLEIGTSNAIVLKYYPHMILGPDCWTKDVSHLYSVISNTVEPTYNGRSYNERLLIASKGSAIFKIRIGAMIQ